MKKINQCFLLFFFTLISPFAYGSKGFDIKDYRIRQICHPVRSNPYHVDTVNVYWREARTPGYTNLPVFVLGLTYRNGTGKEIIGEDTFEISDYGYQAHSSEKLGFDLQTDGDGVRKYYQLIHQETEKKIPMKCEFITP